jgi:hypothetical protein
VGTHGTLGEKVTVSLNKCLTLRERETGKVVYPSTGFASSALFSMFPSEMIDEDVVNGKKWLVIEGCLVYRTFEKVRHSTFCYFYRGGMTKPEHLNACPSGNYAD